MDDLLRLLPPIRRARGARLYAADSRRFLDLWLDDGRGILGERDRHARTLAANAADKGLLRPYPGLYDARFAKAVKAAWPGVELVRAFSSEAGAMAAARRVLGPAFATIDPAMVASGGAVEGAGAGEGPADALALARPFLPLSDRAELFMPRLPCPAPYAPWCLAARGTAAKALEAEPGDMVPAQALMAAARGLSGIEAAVRDGYGEDEWGRFDKRLGEYFERRGPYLRAKVSASGHRAFFEAALAGGALVSPRPGAPSTVPPGFDDGELARLARALSAL